MCVPRGARACMQVCLCPCVHTLICVGSRGMWAGIVLAEGKEQHRPAAVSSEFGDSYLVVGGASLQGRLEKRFMTPQAVLLNGSPLMIQ